MTSKESSNVRRSSLGPPKPDGKDKPPNAFMVDVSNVRTSVTQHLIQYDRKIESEKARTERIAEEHKSSAHAYEVIEDWHKRDSIAHSTSQIHQFHTHDQIKK